ncbi:MAG: hypothetical protein KC620_25610, partial [Myxococcales bacterium]|nr:hypothetical protein [Myxococcales bacterium]
GTLKGKDADAMHDAVVDALIPARRDLGRALEATGAQIDMPTFEVGFDLDAPRFRAFGLERDAVLRAIEAIESDRQALERAELADREAAVRITADETRDLNDVRLALLTWLSPEYREALMGIGRKGIEQLQRELGHLQLMTRWYVYHRTELIDRVPTWLIEVFGRSTTRWQALEVALLALLILPLVLRHRRLLAWLDRMVRAWAVTSDAGAALARLWRPIHALGLPLLVLGFTSLFFANLLDLLDVTETRLARQVCLMIAWYVVIIAAVHHVLVRLATTPPRPVDEVTSRRLLRSVRIAGRTAVVIMIFLVVSEAVLGRGYLYTLVQDFAWVSAFPIGWYTLRSWRDDILAGYLERAPHGSFAGAARWGQQRLLGTLVALPVALYMAVKRSSQIAARWTLRLEQVRKALAFLFLRRLEKQAETERGQGADLPPLPAELQAALERRDLDDALRVEHFPELTRRLFEIAECRRDGRGAAFAIVGERGVGKTQWLATLAERT